MLQTVNVATKDIRAYEAIVGTQRISEILALAAPLRGARVLHLNATAYGGGVAELLGALVPLMQSLGIHTDWKVMAGAPELWETTKAIHNLLQGASIAESVPSSVRNTRRGRRAVDLQRTITAQWTPRMENIWQRYNELTAEMFEGDYDFVVVHDPQPAGVLEYLARQKPENRATKWIWRCHIDLTRASPDVWGFLRPYLARYDAAIFTMLGYVKSDVPTREIALIAPAIDPP